LINISAEGLKGNDQIRMLEGIKDLPPHGLVYSDSASSAKKIDQSSRPDAQISYSIESLFNSFQKLGRLRVQ
jgi:hypothetical protein